jgi:hypothetical protein
MRGPAITALTTALFPCPFTEWDPRYTSQEQAWFNTEVGNFLSDGWWKFAIGHITIPGSQLLHLLNSSMKEPIQGRQPLKLCCPITFMSPSSPASVRQYVKDVAM